MIGDELGTSFIASLILGGLLVFAMRWRHPTSHGPMGSVLFLWPTFFLPLWAAGTSSPSRAPGPPRLLLALGLTVLLLAVSPPGGTPAGGIVQDAPRRDCRISTTFGPFFWVMVIAYLVPVAGGHLH